eukprot:TRINITY_DN4901_c0_g1_i2.p1 TRINITY_DN4901_c0_g1~~TRINITY_DN4901_c0_g1_i2.p1  ORF type:complete len:825 (+),score=325.36 TRINITY_DN4901_c0_g1_i2:40-2475(+)
MLRGLLALAWLSVAAAADHKPFMVAQVLGDKLELHQDLQARMAGEDSSPLVVIGGIGDGSGLSTLFNVVAAAASGASEAAGFPVDNTDERPAVWAMHTDMKTSAGERILLLSCEHCSYSARGIEAIQDLFHFTLRSSHHFIYHTGKITEVRVDKFEGRIRYSKRIEQSKKLPELGSAEDTARTETEDTPITWVWTGEEYSKGAVVDFFESFNGDKSKPNLVPVPFPVNDEHISALRASTLSMQYVKQEFVEAATNVVIDASASTRDWNVNAASLFTYMKVVRDVINENELDPAAMDMNAITQASLKDRKNYALGLYKDVLGYISRGNKQWISKVLPPNTASRPSGLLDAVNGGSSLVQLVKEVASTTGAEGSPEIWSNVVAPASQEEYRIGEEMTWDFALKFFSSGFGASPDAMQTKQELRVQIQEAKEQVREEHLNMIKAYVNQLFEVVKESVQKYYTQKDVPAICSPAVLKKMSDELLADTALLFGPARGWWPRYDLVNQYEKETKAFIQNEYEQRIIKSNQLIHDEVTRIAENELKEHGGRCRKQDDGTPMKTHELAAQCEASKKDVFAKLKAATGTLPEGMCKGEWVFDSASYVQTVGNLEMELSKQVSGVMAENSALLAKAMDEEAEKLRAEARDTFKGLEDEEVPDEDQLDKAARDEVAKASTAMEKKWGSWDKGIYDNCIRHMASGVDEDLMDSKGRIERRLFGSEEVRKWMEAWKATLDDAVAQDFMCRLHPYFIKKRLLATAEDSAPTEITGTPLSSGFRSGLIRKAVNKELNEVVRTADLELVVYALIVLPIVGIAVKIIA